MKAWRELEPGRKLLYLAAVILPLAGILLYAHVQGPFITDGLWMLFWALPVCGLLLGAANLILIFSGHPPRENRGLWEGLLAVSLVPDLGLLGFSALVGAMLRYGLPVPS